MNFLNIIFLEKKELKMILGKK